MGLEREQLEPQFLIKGQKITAKLGDTVVLPCKVANLGELGVLSNFDMSLNYRLTHLVGKNPPLPYIWDVLPSCLGSR